MALPKERPPGLDSPVTAAAIKYGARANTALFRLTRGRIGGRWRIGAAFRKPVPVLLLHHVGRRSGKEYATPLLYLESWSDLVVVGSQGGLPADPQWVHNLRAQPAASVTLPGGAVRRVTARIASAEERASLWPRLVDLYADFDSYQSWTDREIPVVILGPAPDPAVEPVETTLPEERR